MAATAQTLIRYTTLLERPRSHPLAIHLLLAALLAMPIAPLAATATSLQISQGIANSTDVLLYTAVRDEAGEPAAEPEPAEPEADTAPAESGEDTAPAETMPETPAATDAASEPPAQDAEQPAPEPPALWWKRPEVLGGGAGLLLLLLLLLALKRRQRKTTATEPTQDEDGSERQQPTAVAQPIVASPTETASTSASPAPPASIRLIALDGSACRDFSLDSPLTIGRDESNRWPLPGDDTVSSEHARILERGDVLVLEDLGSTNGTFLNGVTVKAANPLHDGDLIRIGELELRVVLQKDQ